MLVLEIFDTVAQVVKLCLVPNDIGKDTESCQRGGASGDEEDDTGSQW